MGQSSSDGSGEASWFRSELGVRIASALVLALLALALTYVGGWPFDLLWLLAGSAIVIEWLAVTRCRPLAPLRIVCVLGLAAGTACRLLAAPPAATAGALLLGAIAAALVGRSGRDRAWAGAGLAYAAVVVLVPPLVRADPRFGVAGIVWMFIVVWATDVAAFFVGRAFGGPKLCPAISPKKTWSGFCGGLLAGTAGGALVGAGAGRFGWVVPVVLPLVAAASAAASVLSQLGDLGESGLKRTFAVKDSGRLIPGHGGAMDRLDGFWAVAALAGFMLATRSV